MDIVTLGAALSGAKAYTDATIAPLLGGVHYRGSVNYFNNLPSNPAEGDAYTVKYLGTSGTSPDGTEYVWALDTDDNTYKWIGFSPDTYTKAEVDNLLTGKQDTLVVGTNLDDEPTEDSTNPITSGGVFNTVGNIDAALDSLIMSLEHKTITANGTYDPTDDGVDGYSEVTVNVPSGNANYVYDSSAGVNFAPKFALESITIPDGYYTVASETFSNYNALKTVNFPSSVYAISSKAFQGCTSLTSIEIPSSITQIAYNAFSGCTNLATITINKPEGSISDAPWGATNATVVWAG